jgi:uncharacterized protein YbaP (TraB family)
MKLPGFWLRCALILGMFWSGSALADGDSALYWKVLRDGETVGFLLGTIHSEDPRVLDFSEAFMDELESNQVFAMEMVPNLPTMAKLTEYMQYADGTTLESQVGPERYARLETVLGAYQIPAGWIDHMKVWAVMMTLSVPPPETGFFMDFSLSLRAAGAGLKVVGLETLEQQLSFLENMPMEFQLALLDSALDEYGEVKAIHSQMVDCYLEGDLAALKQVSNEQMQKLPAEAGEYFMAQGIDARNGRMIDALVPRFDAGRVFTAVGALHLPGEHGLVALLRARGFELEPLPMPFSVPQGGGQADDQSGCKKADAP